MNVTSSISRRSWEAKLIHRVDLANILDHSKVMSALKMDSVAICQMRTCWFPQILSGRTFRSLLMFSSLHSFRSWMSEHCLLNHSNTFVTTSLAVILTSGSIYNDARQRSAPVLLNSLYRCRTSVMSKGKALDKVMIILEVWLLSKATAVLFLSILHLRSPLHISLPAVLRKPQASSILHRLKTDDWIQALLVPKVWLKLIFAGSENMSSEPDVMLRGSEANHIPIGSDIC